MKEKDFLKELDNLGLSYDQAWKYLNAHIKIVEQRKKYGTSEKAKLAAKKRRERDRDLLRKAKEMGLN